MWGEIGKCTHTDQVPIVSHFMQNQCLRFEAASQCYLLILTPSFGTLNFTCTDAPSTWQTGCSKTLERAWEGNCQQGLCISFPAPGSLHSMVSPSRLLKQHAFANWNLFSWFTVVSWRETSSEASRSFPL